MIKELNRFADELTAYRKINALPQGEVKNALVDIYEANWHNHKNWGSSKINRGCPSCIGDMMKSLAAQFESQLKYEKFEGIPVEAALLEEIEVEDIPEEKYKELEVPAYQNIVEYHLLKWGELKSFATKHGINVKGKKKVDILAELDEKFND